LPIPYYLRGIVIGTYSWLNKAKMEEAIEPNFYAYSSLSEWFGRALKPQLRPISDADLVN